MPTQTPASAPRGTQKVSRSAVAAPARKPTTKQKKSAPSPRRRPKKPNIFVRFLHGLVRRLYFGSKTLFKFALFIPILVFMVWFSYTVDRSGLFQGELAPRRIVDLMLQGYDVSNFEQMNEIEREVVQLFAQDVPDTPEVIVCYGKAPKVLIWSVDPWVLYGDEAAFDKRADVELYNEFLTKVLGVETDYEEEDRVALWKALVEPAYFQGNVDYYLKNRGQSVVTDDDGNPIDFNPVDGDPYEQPTTIKRSDGSVLYDPTFRDANTDQVRALAAEACPTFNSVHMEGFDSLSPKQEEAFDKFIQYAQNQGTTVILALSPWHPYLYDFLLTETDQHQGFFETENWIRQYAHDYNIPLYGSYDPTCIKGLDETDFFDGLHCKGCGIAKFFPGVPQVLQDVENNTLPDPLSVTPRTTLPVDGEENVENVG